jgi:flavin reductase (DIM6/NTAB) family NADH-FMN oxidoreductase RutF
MVDVPRFRNVMGHFATGVTVVTASRPEGGFLGLTVNAFTSVSLNPLLVLICVNRAALSHDELLDSGAFAVNVLAEDQEEVAIRFAGGDPRTRFTGVEVTPAPSGSPILAGVLAWLDCRVVQAYPGGDHSVIVARVTDCEARTGEPLIFFRGRMRGLGP